VIEGGTHSPVTESVRSVLNTASQVSGDTGSTPSAEVGAPATEHTPTATSVTRIDVDTIFSRE
jgi:hypothetical protein